MRKSFTYTKPYISLPLGVSGLVVERQDLATQALIWGKGGKCISGQQKCLKKSRSEKQSLCVVIPMKKDGKPPGTFTS